MADAYIYPSSYASGGSTTGSTSQAVQSSANAMSKIPGGFGTGFKMGYAAGNTFFEPIIAYQSAKLERKKLEMQGKIAKMQSNVYNTAADDAKAAGMQQAASIGYQAGQTKSNVRAKQAASGVRVGGSGTAAEILASIDIAKEMNINQTIANAVTTSWGYRKSAVSFSNQALAYKCAAKNISPFAAAITSLSNNLASMGDMNMGGNSGGGQGANAASAMSFGGSSSDVSGMGGGTGLSFDATTAQGWGSSLSNVDISSFSYGG